MTSFEASNSFLNVKSGLFLGNCLSITEEKNHRWPAYWSLLFCLACCANWKEFFGKKKIILSDDRLKMCLLLSTRERHMIVSCDSVVI